jgi:hypothetical protein
VQKECENRGVALYANDTKIYGCTDFASRVIVSVPATRMCHAAALARWPSTLVWIRGASVCPDYLAPSEFSCSSLIES